MDEKIVELFDGVTLHLIKTNRFKTDFVAIFLLTELNRNTVTMNALIPAVLSRGTENLPTMKDISVCLEERYGSVLDASSDKIGDRQVLQFYVSSINSMLTFKHEELLKNNIDLICDMIFKPRLVNGIFDEEVLNQEKEVLRDLIKSKINNKGTYANSRCIEEMCKDEPYGLYKYGYEEDIDKITNEELFLHYQKIISTSEIHIYVSGDIDEANVKKQFEKCFGNFKRNYDAVSFESKSTENMKKELQTVIEEQDVNQGKLVLGLRSRNSVLAEDLYPLVLYNAILGGTPSSKLFQNVREKASLAYTTRSSYLKHKSIVLVSAGIEIDNYDKALELINVQLQDMKKGNFSKEDITNAKIALKNAYRSYLDDQSAIINLYMGEQILGNTETVKQMTDNIDGVTKEEIVRVANGLELETIYFLRNRINI